MKHQYGFGKDGNIDKGVGPNKTLVYEIKLVSFEKAKESWQLDADAKLEQVIADAKFCVDASPVNIFRPKYSKTKNWPLATLVAASSGPLDSSPHLWMVPLTP